MHTLPFSHNRFVDLYNDKQPIIEKMLSQNLVNKAIQIKDGIDYEYVKQITKEHKEGGTLLILDDGVDLISTDLRKLFLEGNREKDMFFYF